MTVTRVLVLGGGFAGTSAAQELARRGSHDELEVTLVDRHNFQVFTPMLTELAGGEVDYEDVVVPIRRLLPDVTFIEGEVEHIDAASRQVTVGIPSGDGKASEARTLEADHLVVALGSETNFHGISGLKERALTVDSVTGAEDIRNHVLRRLEWASAEEDSDRRAELLTFVVGGGGFSGVETMAALNDLARDSVASFPRLSSDQIQTTLIQPSDRLLPEVSPDLASAAQKALEARGVRVILNTKITSATEKTVRIDPAVDERSELSAGLLVWAGGVKPSPAIQHSGAELGKHGGLVTDGCFRVKGHTNVWALGDCAEIPDRETGKTLAPTAQNATREGPAVAANILAVLRGEQPQPFAYKPLGELALVGKRSGVASVYGLHISGLPAWAMWRAVYLAKMPRWANRVRVGASWLLDLIFGRETAQIQIH